MSAGPDPGRSAFFNSTDLDGPIPFHLMLDEHLEITSIGSSIQKLVPDLELGKPFTDQFQMVRPMEEIKKIKDLDELHGRLVLVEARSSKLRFRGSFWPLENGRGYLFASTPLMNKAEDLEQLGLMLTDFAPHDPVTDFLFAIRARDVTLDEVRGAVERQQLLMNELDHRVKNTLAAVLTLASLTAGEASSSDDFSKRFEGRVNAMALAHELLASAGWKKLCVETMLQTILGAFINDDPTCLELNGPSAMLEPLQAGPLSMAVHELAMNAFKHGAWTDQAGKVEVSWALEDGRLEIKWVETGGPPINESPSAGVGLDLVRGFIEHELKGDLAMTSDQDGLIIRMSILEPANPS